MVHKLIKTDNYLLVVDEDVTQAKEGCIIYRSDIGITYCHDRFYFDFKEPYKKVVSHLRLNNAPILEGVDLLPYIEDDVEQLAEDYGDSIGNKNGTAAFDFKRGYNKARERYQYTEEDMKKAYETAFKEAKKGCSKSYFDKFIQSLSQFPTEFECELEHIPCPDGINGCLVMHYIPKTTTNSQGQKVWVGKYK